MRQHNGRRWLVALLLAISAIAANAWPSTGGFILLTTLLAICAALALQSERQGERYETDWCRQHLNWTWIIVSLLLGLTPVIFGYLAVYIICTVIYVMVNLWVLDKKGQSWVWIFASIVIPFLSNKRRGEAPIFE